MTASIVDNSDLSRYELRAGDDLVGWLDYRPGGESVIIAHTEVGQQHEGNGYGGMLVAAAIEGIRAAGKSVLVVCPFATGYIRRHPELDDGA